MSRRRSGSRIVPDDQRFGGSDPAYRVATPTHVLRRDVGQEVEFVPMLWFDSLEGVLALAGEDFEVAYVLPKARAVLSRYDARSRHYETVLAP